MHQALSSRQNHVRGDDERVFFAQLRRRHEPSDGNEAMASTPIRRTNARATLSNLSDVHETRFAERIFAGKLVGVTKN